MEFNDLLTKRNINPEAVILLRHRPMEPQLRKVLPWLAAERDDVFNAYQQTQGPIVEKAMRRASFVASFIGHKPQRALFVGLYSIGNATPLSRRRYWQVPAYREMKTLGMIGFSDNDPRQHVLWFDLKQTEFCAGWKGKLVVHWPPPERSWWRWAQRNIVHVEAILPESAFSEAMPDWDQLVLDWEQLRLLPASWRAALSQWRGIYYIFDQSDGKGYVGSAYGRDNILGRWLGYASSGHGNNRLLRRRNANNFQFSLLQRVSPDLEPANVIRLESQWKDRLHSRDPYGLNDN